MTKPSGAGSPEATPRLNGLARHFACARTIAGAATKAAAPVATKWRRVSMHRRDARLSRQTLKRNSSTSPSWTTYSLPSERILPASLRAGLAAELDEIVIGDRLGADEAALEVGVDLARRFRRLGAAVHRPGARFLRAGGEEGDEAEQLVAGVDHAGEPGLVEAEVGEEMRRAPPPGGSRSRPRSRPR